LELEKCNAFSLLIEGTCEEAARKITNSVKIPTIGIGASPECDGQVLVTEDALGLFSDYTPRFAKQYIDLSALIREAFARFEDDVAPVPFRHWNTVLMLPISHNSPFHQTNGKAGQASVFQALD
jgi:3-methyl-2-oxobutanoate hydroxymethyltransferase